MEIEKLCNFNSVIGLYKVGGFLAVRDELIGDVFQILDFEINGFEELPLTDIYRQVNDTLRGEK